MLASKCLWIRQLFESMMEASMLYECFQQAFIPNIDDLDKPLELHKECREAYIDLCKISFETFVELGKSLRTRQAHKNTHRI